jgi:aryl-alcohol dehydrogenase-like predicted oxidoreductase
MAYAATRSPCLGGCVLQKRRLGQTDMDVSIIGLGTVKFGRNQGVKYPTAFVLPEDSEIKKLLSLAREEGINLLDTAPAYGSSEERLGKLLQGQRHAWIITTKVGEDFVNGESSFDFSTSAVCASIDRSLQRLRTDYLDIVLVHSDGNDERIIKEQDIFATLNMLKKAGKIRAYGMSTKTAAGGMLTVQHADLAMVTYNPQCTDDNEIIKFALQNKKGIFIKKALGSGHLPAEEALRFVFAQPGVTSVIVGTINPEHLKQNIDSLS